MHTNPILITFVNLLYYKKLQEFLRRHHREKRDYLARNPDTKPQQLKLGHFRGLLPPHKRGPEAISYNQSIVSKWHLLCFLNKNRGLIMMRKHNILREEIKEARLGFIRRLKAKLNELIALFRRKKFSLEHHDHDELDVNQNNLATFDLISGGLHNNAYFSEFSSSAKLFHNEPHSSSSLLATNKSSTITRLRKKRSTSLVDLRGDFYY